MNAVYLVNSSFMLHYRVCCLSFVSLYNIVFKVCIDYSISLHAQPLSIVLFVMLVITLTCFLSLLTHSFHHLVYTRILTLTLASHVTLQVVSSVASEYSKLASYWWCVYVVYCVVCFLCVSVGFVTVKALKSTSTPKIDWECAKNRMVGNDVNYEAKQKKEDHLRAQTEILSTFI